MRMKPTKKEIIDWIIYWVGCYQCPGEEVCSDIEPCDSCRMHLAATEYLKRW
jgi:hypothetical protein